MSLSGDIELKTDTMQIVDLEGYARELYDEIGPRSVAVAARRAADSGWSMPVSWRLQAGWLMTAVGKEIFPYSHSRIA